MVASFEPCLQLLSLTLLQALLLASCGVDLEGRWSQLQGLSSWLSLVLALSQPVHAFGAESS